MSTKRLTALIPAHNEAYMLELCLASIYEHFDEIIVLDDASTDGTGKMAEGFLCEHWRWKVLRAREGIGWIESRNRLCAATDSDWLFFLDADDVLCEYNAHLLREIAEGPEPVVRLQLTELWGDFHHTTGRLRHYDRCHTFVNRAIIKDLAWIGGSAAKPYGNGRGGWRAAAGPGPLLFHCKGVKPDRRLVERSMVRGWLRAGAPGTLEAWAGLDKTSPEEIHRRALKMLLQSKQDRIRRYPDQSDPSNPPDLPQTIRQAPTRFEITYDFAPDGAYHPTDRIDHQVAV
jgi:hypothetical protein